MPRLLPDQSFYPSPTMAMQAPVETLAYVAMLNPIPLLVPWKRNCLVKKSAM